MLEQQKQERVALKANHDAALAIINRDPPTPKGKLSAHSLEVLLTWHQIPKKDMGKKDNKLALWTLIHNSGKPPPLFEDWTEENEAELFQLKTKQFDLGDTALGRAMKVKKMELEGAIRSFNKEEQDDLLAKMILLNNFDENVA